MTKDWVVGRFEEFVHNYYALCDERELSWTELKRLTEFEFLLDEFVELCDFSDNIDKISLERISEIIADTVVFDRIIFYYSSFHYFYNDIRNGNYDISQLVYRMNIQINIVKIQIEHNMALGESSENDYFFDSRGDELVKALEILARAEQADDIDYNSVLYLALNYEDALLDYVKSGSKCYYESACGLIERCMNTVKVYCKKFDLKMNVKLLLFIHSVYDKYCHIMKNDDNDGAIEKIKKIEESNVILNNIWAARNIYDFDKDYFVRYFNENLSEYENFYDGLNEESKIVYLRDCIRVLKETDNSKIEQMKLPPFDGKADRSCFKLDDYFNGYSDSASVEITEEEINSVLGYNDQVLRGKLANVIKNIDRHVIEKESTKTHSGYEISDMELPVRREKGTYYICIPVKSGAEIKTKVKEDVTYQVIRPFTYFGNRAIVVFVSAKEVTEAFRNYIKRATARLNLDIYLISDKALVRLLKYNGQI